MFSSNNKRSSPVANGCKTRGGLIDDAADVDKEFCLKTLCKVEVVGETETATEFESDVVDIESALFAEWRGIPIFLDIVPLE